MFILRWGVRKTGNEEGTLKSQIHAHLSICWGENKSTREASGTITEAAAMENPSEKSAIKNMSRAQLDQTKVPSSPAPYLQSAQPDPYGVVDPNFVPSRCFGLHSHLGIAGLELGLTGVGDMQHLEDAKLEKTDLM